MNSQNRALSAALCRAFHYFETKRELGPSPTTNTNDDADARSPDRMAEDCTARASARSLLPRAYMRARARLTRRRTEKRRCGKRLTLRILFRLRFAAFARQSIGRPPDRLARLQLAG